MSLIKKIVSIDMGINDIITKITQLDIKSTELPELSVPTSIVKPKKQKKQTLLNSC